ncbi:hypothetical protein [Streptomyces sp. NPDC005784]|uniref:hypothetical protein n=1 Tax=Streptomyces sp. NPDC005784 TaxID=3364731 RepID=UPI0036B75979
MTPVPAERSPDDRESENRQETEEVSRREALKGQVDPASAEPAPGDRARNADRARNGDDAAARPTGPTGIGTTARGATGVDVGEREARRGDRTGRTGSGDASRASDGPGPSPVPGDAGEALPRGGTADTKSRTGTGTGTGTEDRAGRDERMLPLDEYDKFSLRMRHAVGGFVDGPQASVEEADHVLEELAGRLTEAVTRRRRALRTSWQSGGEGEGKGEGKGTASDTEQLRLALRDYREMTERLLRL